MRFKNISEQTIRVASYGWVKPGAVIEIHGKDDRAVANLKTMPAFEKVTTAKKTAKPKTSEEETR